MNNMELRNFRQAILALNDHLNRHATRVEHNCDDVILSQHPDWLIMHFVQNGGAFAFAQFNGSVSEFAEPEYYI